MARLMGSEFFIGVLESQMGFDSQIGVMLSL
jgi:hypothetical protein